MRVSFVFCFFNQLAVANYSYKTFESIAENNKSLTISFWLAFTLVSWSWNENNIATPNLFKSFMKPYVIHEVITVMLTTNLQIALHWERLLVVAAINNAITDKIENDRAAFREMASCPSIKLNWCKYRCRWWIRHQLWHQIQSIPRSSLSRDGMRLVSSWDWWQYAAEICVRVHWSLQLALPIRHNDQHQSGLFLLKCKSDRKLHLSFVTSIWFFISGRSLPRIPTFLQVNPVLRR